MKEDGKLDRSGALNALKVLKPVDLDLYQKLMGILVTCGLRGLFFST